MAGRRLLLYVEPTPYIAALLSRLTAGAEDGFETWFITENLSQAWGRDERAARGGVLFRPGEGAWRGLRCTAALLGRILTRHYAAAHLAGWGHRVLLVAMVCLKLSATPFTLESDSQLRASEARVRAWLKRLVYPILLRWPRVVLPAGRRQAELFRFYGVPSDRIQIAYLTVDVTAIRALSTLPATVWRARHSVAEGAVVFLFVGRLEPHKGLGVLLDAFDRLWREPAPVRLVVVGDGSLRAEVERRAAAAGPGLVRVEGRLPHPQVVQWMRAADALVVPSLFEPWGLVVNEGMACGLPIVATDRVGASDDLIEHGENGLIVPAGDPRALADAMRALRDDPAARQRMSERSASRIGAWTIEREADVVRAAMESVAS